MNFLLVYVFKLYVAIRVKPLLSKRKIVKDMTVWKTHLSKNKIEKKEKEKENLLQLKQK